MDDMEIHGWDDSMYDMQHIAKAKTLAPGPHQLPLLPRCRQQLSQALQ